VSAPPPRGIRSDAVRIYPLRSARPACTQTAFTLIELLVVVAIIAILLAILLPALNGAREQSKQLLCLTNLRSMGQAVHQYAEDNRDYVARSEWGGGATPWATHFAATMLPYLGYDGAQGRAVELWDPGPPPSKRRRLLNACRNMELYQCPSFPVEEQALDYVVSGFNIPLRPSDITDPGQPTNSNDVRDQQTNRIPTFSRRSEIDPYRPGGLIYVTEASARIPPDINDSNGSWGNYHDVFSPTHIPFGSNSRVASDQRHPAGINALLFDSHAETMSLTQVDPGWPNLLELRMQHFSQVPDTR